MQLLTFIFVCTFSLIFSYVVAIVAPGDIGSVMVAFCIVAVVLSPSYLVDGVLDSVDFCVVIPFVTVAVHFVGTVVDVDLRRFISDFAFRPFDSSGQRTFFTLSIDSLLPSINIH